MMYNPAFRVLELFDGSRMIDIGDYCDPNYGLKEVHFSICIKPDSAMVIFINNHTRERIVFEGTSDISRIMKTNQYAYNVYYIKGRQDDYKVLKGVHFTDKSKGTTYKQFLTKALLRASEELDKKYGLDWLFL